MTKCSLGITCVTACVLALGAQAVGGQMPGVGDTLRVTASAERVRMLGDAGVRLAVLDKTIALDLDEVPVAAAMEAIARDAGLTLTYGDEAIPQARRVSLKAANITVTDALLVALRGTGLDAVVSTTGVLVLVRHGAPLAVATRHQGGGTIAGQVVDMVTRAPLDQVAVRVEGPALAGVTTSDGRYAVHNIPPGTYRATARRVGYTPLTKTVTVSPNSATTVDFAVAAAPTRLNEMVTTAVGDQRRYEVGNTISTINADSIVPTAPITSLTDLISARAPGVTVEETGGLTGSGETIRIRGQSSLVLQGDPIVIVDGVRQNNAPGGTATLQVVGFFATSVPSPNRLNDLNFADIQSIDVLKGPAASTEYGTDAANGVIVVTTKRGIPGRPQWTVSAEQTTSKIPQRFPTLDYTWGHTPGPNGATVQCPLVPYVYTSGYGSAAGTCVVDSVTTWDPLNNAHYSIFGVGRHQKYDLSVNGGSDATRYFVAGALSNETGILQMPRVFVSEAEALKLPRSAFQPNSEGQRSVRTNNAVRLGSTADLTAAGAYLSTYQETPNAQELYNGVFLTPPLRDSAAAYGYGRSSYLTPLYQLGLQNSERTDRLTGGLTGNWHPLPWLVANSIVGIDHSSGRATASVLPQVAALNSSTPAQLGIENGTTDIYTVDLRVSATAAVSRAMRATTSAGLQLADRRMQGTTATAMGITATNVTLNGAVNPAVTQLGDRQATLGGYGEEQLGFADRLFLTGAIRIDAGSGFGRAYSTVVYPKASLSWLATNSGPTTVRLRGAFGESGVQPPNGAALQLYAPTLVWLNGGSAGALAVANVQNQLLQPERSVEYEGGIDVGLWQNRMSLELTGYSKTTRHALVNTATGWEAGSYPYEENVGEVRNNGIEGALTATLAQTRMVTWDVSLNGSLNRNKLVTLGAGSFPQQLNGSTAVFRFAAGYPLYGYWAPRVRYADANHDGIIASSEVTVADSMSYVGSSLPTREASLGTHIGVWGGAVSVGALIDYRGGFRLLNASAFYQATSAQSDRASNDRTAPLWQQARDVAGEVINVTGLDGYVPPAGFYEDATYLRFRELSVTYGVPRSVARALRVQRLSLTGAVRNLALWTRYTGSDPEVTNSVGANTRFSPTSNTFILNHDVREDVAAVPLLRYFVARLNIQL